MKAPRLPKGEVRHAGGVFVGPHSPEAAGDYAERHALRRLAPAIVTRARAEGLEGHARSVEVRITE